MSANTDSFAIDRLLLPPTDAEAERALEDFARAAQSRYGDRLAGLFLFGSRSRGDHRPDSDADVAAVLKNDGWRFLDEKLVLSELAIAPLTDFGLYIQAWPFSEDEWAGRSKSVYLGSTVESARRDAISLVRTP